MIIKKNYILIFMALFLSCFATSSAAEVSNYPNFIDNPFLNTHMRAAIAPHLLPLDHPMKPVLDSIFSQSRVLENERSLIDGGFEVIAGPTLLSFVIVARHFAIPGYVFKLYLDSESRCRKQIPHWRWLAMRCIGAKGIKKLIKKNKIKYFSVPDKWLYLLPIHPFSSVINPQPVILMETDMEPECYEVTAHMWKTAITPKHLDELYSILKEGHGGHGLISLVANVPYTKRGKFAFTDTEDPQADLDLKYVKRFFSKDMQCYWDKLINQ